ncbi:hypothetical protein GCM10022204_40340 [Microlunatus aurantiacus]|uniref:Methyltransferase domain-containing protein n=1 Tax=Microlunatus aurantiacus TaxID=446786 RepID=A0ABP7EAH2_9ACTN
MDYSYKDYWRDLHERADLSTVGHSALPPNINKWIYRSLRRNLRHFVRRHGLIGGAGGRLLEVGVGTGYWVDFWTGLGWTVDGCDLVPSAITRLRAARPGSRFWVADVSAEAGILADSGGAAYDLVTVLSVLLHVTRDDAFEQALANVAAATKPGGHLLLMEPALTVKKTQSPFDPTRSSRARVVRTYVTPLRKAGFELIALEATTVLAANPIEGGSPRRRAVYGRWWQIVSATRQRPGLARFVGPAMYIGDALLMRTKDMPTSKLLLFRKTEAVT